jgi:hypothetical protein
MSKNSPSTASVQLPTKKQEVILQKSGYLQGQFHVWDEEKEQATDFIGSIDVKDGMNVSDYVQRLQNLVKALKKQKGSVFVIQ